MTSNTYEVQSKQPVAFLYMDEKYLDATALDSVQVTSLTGLLLRADVYPIFRHRFYRLLPGFAKGTDNFPINVHASDLFRDETDEEHFEFYMALVTLVNELGCRIYRRGFNFAPPVKDLRKVQRTMLWFCCRSMLIAVHDSYSSGQIWPVMESDLSDAQDKSFAGYVRWMDHSTEYLNMIGGGVKELIANDWMVDNARVGDMLYVNKRSIAGSAVDCFAYLLHCRWLHDRDVPLSKYKRQLAEIAHRLDSAIVDDAVQTYVPA